MDFMDILSEARAPKVRNRVNYIPIDFSSVIEAPTNIDGSLEDTDTEDYNSDVEADTADTGADDTATEDETTDEEPTSDDDTSTEEETTDEETTDEEAPEEDEATDYSAETEEITVDDTGEGDTTSEEETTEETDESDIGNLSNKSLIGDFIALYDSINTTIDKLDNLPISDMEALSISITTKRKLAKLTDFIYAYVTRLFRTKTYSENLYIYKYIVQLYKISIEILSKINKIH